MSDEVAAQRGRLAAEILASDVYKDAYEAVRQEYMHAWMQSPAGDVEGRESLFMMIKILDKVRADMAAQIATGKMAQATLDAKAKRAVGINTRFPL